MNISVFGLGYVGAVTTACLARDNHTVVGVDINPDKVASVARGESPIIEAGLPELLAAGVKAGRISTTTSALDAVEKTEVSLVSVATPSRADGSLDLTALFSVCRQIGDAVAAKGTAHVVALRSTVFPGTTDECGKVFAQCSGNVPVHVAFNPEFLREGVALKDFDAPAYSIIGTTDATAAAALRRLYATVRAPIFVTEPATAELLKLVSNAWHATKICFANEIGRLAANAGADGREVMEIFVQDTKLNVSPTYLRPGFAFGGSCLPKDLRALTSFARLHNVEVPLLVSLARTNQLQIELAVADVLATGKRRVGLLGLAFKPGTDDLRESPAVELAERLMGKGCDIRILDHAVREAKLIGANRAYIEQRIPHLASLLAEDAAALLRHAEVIVATHDTAEFRALAQQAGVPTLSLA
jgi:GDP-mannose 6-dehydrogenase